MLDAQPDEVIATAVAVDAVEALIDQPVTQLVDHVVSMAKPTVARRSCRLWYHAIELRQCAYARPPTGRQ